MFFLVAVAGAVVFERFFDKWADDFWEKQNQGLLWKHIKDNYGSENSTE